jgi:hypothetical protein
LDGLSSTPNPGATSSQGNQGMLANVNQGSPRANLNLQQPFYQTMAYGPNIPPMGNGVPHVPVPDVLFPRTLAHDTPNTVNDHYGGMAEGVRE